MKTMRLITVAAALLALTAIQAAAAQDASTTQPAGPGTAPQPATVAVCDMAAVFKNYDRANDLNKKLKSRVEELKAEAKKRGDEIDKIQNTIEELKPGSKESDAALDKMTKLTIERQAWINFQDELAKREDFRLTKDLYNDVLVAVEKIAREKGFQVVLSKETSNQASHNIDELLQQMSRRKVLYSDPSLDITEDVIKQLNRDYAAKHATP